MKNPTKNSRWLLPLAVAWGVMLMGMGCGEEIDPNLNPQQAILGKWEVIEDDSGPISYPGSYSEYRKDSVLFIYVSEEDYSYGKYWFVDSLLFEKYIYLDKTSGDTTLIVTHPFKFEFLSSDKLKLDIQQPAMIITHIYKRIN